MLIAVNFHYVRPAFTEPHPGIHGATVASFERQLVALSRHGQFVGPDTVRAAVAGELALPRHAILVTFDDGLREQFEHALPVLRRLGIPALFFANTAPIAAGTVSSVHKLHLTRANVSPDEFVELLRRHARRTALELLLKPTSEAVAQYRYDTPAAAQLKYVLNFLLPRSEREQLIDACFAEVFPGRESAISRSLYMEVAQLRELCAAGMLGTHGHEHLPLGSLPAEAAERTLADSLSWLEAWTGVRPYALSYPYGSRDACTEEVGTVAARLGLEFAFTMERAVNHHLEHPLFLARYSASDVPDGQGPAGSVADFFEAAGGRTWHAPGGAAMAL